MSEFYNHSQCNNEFSKNRVIAKELKRLTVAVAINCDDDYNNYICDRMEIKKSPNIEVTYLNFTDKNFIIDNNKYYFIILYMSEYFSKIKVKYYYNK